MDEPARPVALDAWLRWYWLWDAYFAVGFVAVSALVLSEGDEPVARKVAAVAVLTAMAVWYLAFGRRLIVAPVRVTEWQARIFVGGIVLLVVVAVALHGSASFALFSACPLIFMTLELREAIPVVVLVNLLPPLAVLVRDGAHTMITALGPTSVFTIVFAVAVGTWIHRIVSQSEERGALIRELEESREEISRLSREAGVAAERSRLAAEIHDTIAQGFTSIVTLVQAAESELDRDTGKARRHLALAARTARENLTEARALVAGLMPSELAGTGSLDQAIRRQLSRLAEETSVAVSYRVDGQSVELPTVLEVVLLRMVQEALTNVRRHAKATEVTITLRVDEDRAALRVADNGVGFDPAAATDGFGLRAMRGRAAQIGGRLAVHSGAGGTTVELEVPR